MLSIWMIIILGLMLALAGLHLYWGHGGIWPGTDRQDLIDKVFGEGTKFPSIYACYAVAIALIIAGTIPFFSNHYFASINYLIAVIFLIRGIGGYLPAIEKRWNKIFVHYNRMIYSPLCIGIALSYIFFGLASTLR